MNFTSRVSTSKAPNIIKMFPLESLELLSEEPICIPTKFVSFSESLYLDYWVAMGYQVLQWGWGFFFLRLEIVILAQYCLYKA